MVAAVRYTTCIEHVLVATKQPLRGPQPPPGRQPDDPGIHGHNLLFPAFALRYLTLDGRPATC